MKEVLLKRILENLTDKEKSIAMNNLELMKKIYLIGIIDGVFINKN